MEAAAAASAQLIQLTTELAALTLNTQAKTMPATTGKKMSEQYQ
jgi:hypothetical protein